MDIDSQFKEAYGRLNSAQKEAVDTIEGPVMVVAGPGTGKTQILTLRIANILKETDVQPEQILALTFTESGAQAMRERLRRYIGASAYRVSIHTFHGFAGRLIQEYPDAYTHIIGARPASDIDKIEIIETILTSKDITLLRPIGSPSYYVPHILRTIGTLKQEYIDPDAFLQIIQKQEEELSTIQKIHEKGAHKGKVRGEYQKKEKSIQKNRELLFVYRQYQTLLREQRLYDFDDMIVETVTALQEDGEILLDLQERYQYLLADEHQDVNGSQNKILQLLASYHDTPNLFVVGDEKQAIYRFQGASLENFLYFEDAFPHTKTISLTENYRSGQQVLDASQSLIEDPESPAAAMRIPLVAKAVETADVIRQEFSHQNIEDSAVADRIESVISEGVPCSEIAVIVRTNREVESFAERLRKKGIAVTASADGDILKHPIMASVRELMDVVVRTDTDAALFRVLHGPYWGLGNIDTFRILSARTSRRSLLNILSDKALLESLEVEHIAEAQRIVTVIETAKKYEVSEAPHTVLAYLLTESGFLQHVIEHNPHEGVRVIRRIYDEVEEISRSEQKGVVMLHKVATMFDRLVAHGIQLRAPYITTSDDAVQVMTAHKSKGLEFSHVFIPHVIDAGWGGSRKNTYFDIPLTRQVDADAFDALDDERRLLYVAMTRAKEVLVMSNAHTNMEGRDTILSRLVEEMDADCIRNEDVSLYETKFDLAADVVANREEVTIDAAVLSQVIEERGLSATALNNYLDSPWNYLYRNVLRVPEIRPLPMLFGTAMHGVMELVTKTYTSDSLPTLSDIKNLLEQELFKLPITEHEYVTLHEKGLSALHAYIEAVLPRVSANTKEEFSIKVILETGNELLPEIQLVGNLDRLDFDAEGNVVRVVDYKTGKPKTRNVIEGKTKNSNGHYKRQLVFYALMLELYDNEQYACREGVLSFLEPDGKGVVHEEVFQITDEEIAALKEEIIRVGLEIKNGTFLNMPCDSTQSEYCDLVSRLRFS